MRKKKTTGIENKDWLIQAASLNEDLLTQQLQSSLNGHSVKDVEEIKIDYGKNIVDHGKSDSLIKRIFDAFVNPFTAILLVLAIVSTFTDILWAEEIDKNYVTVIIITSMVMISGILRFIQETRSGNAAAKLSTMIHTTTCVERIETGKQEILLDEVVLGDIVHLSAGDLVPADVRVLYAKDLFVSQSSLTGESEPVEKQAIFNADTNQTLSDFENLAFMGSTIISGSARAIVIAVGNATLLGSMASVLTIKKPITSFEKGVNSVSWILIRFMLIMVPIVLFINGITKNDWLEASLFAISVAVGLTPEMLPMIVTTSLAKGAIAMGDKKVIIKDLNAIQNLGSIDILCTDKTGTLTQDKVVLEYHLNIEGKEDDRVLRHAYLNSYFQTGLKNLIDIAIIQKQHELNSSLSSLYTKVDEIPFDFNRRRMSVVVSDQQGKTQLITKGAVEEMLKCCGYAQFHDQVVPMSDKIISFIQAKTEEYNSQGLRVIAVAQKTNPAPVGQFSVSDEQEMVLIGFLAFLDPPKLSTAKAIHALQEHGVSVKILTGDNEKVTQSICEQVGLSSSGLLMGNQIDGLSDEQLSSLAEETTIFAKLSPDQKARVVTLLRKNGHVVGYMGDGINDAAAMKVADVGISVDSAVDIAKESANVILLEKDLMVLEDGIIEGRKTYANMIKYIKMTASSNFGNMFSVLIASAFLPFLPMASIQLILLNLIYDISCTAIPWDHVDEEFLKVPRDWNASSVSSFMLWLGPVSSIFDITTYLVLYFIICPMVSGGAFHELSDPTLFIATFQAGWFIESMWSQTLVIHMIRTQKLPFIQSRAAISVTVLTFAGALLLTLIPFSPLGDLLGLAPLPTIYFMFLVITLLAYMVLTTFVKQLYIKHHGELL